MAYNNGQFKITKIGTTRKLINVPGYQWKNSKAEEINEVMCEIKERNYQVYLIQQVKMD